ncbi:hypothetical protein B0O99DRAFT_695550 [Bisporella sp. PMI_857]|nr:hypothetical protein B0O99DRAFT_695550 [Bisporella sp. PMI_857]
MRHTTYGVDGVPMAIRRGEEQESYPPGFFERFRQYFVEYKSDDYKNFNNELEKAFTAFITDNKPIADDFDNKLTVVNFTAYGDVDLDSAATTAIELANKACNHAITKLNVTNSTLTENNPFAYKAGSRYTFPNL